jgi:hypothetical protein
VVLTAPLAGCLHSANAAQLSTCLAHAGWIHGAASASSSTWQTPLVSASIGAVIGVVGGLAGALLGIRWDRREHAQDITVNDLARSADVARGRLRDQRQEMAELRGVIAIAAAVNTISGGDPTDAIATELVRLVGTPNRASAGGHADLVTAWAKLFELCSSYMVSPEDRPELSGQLQSAAEEIGHLANAYAASAAVFVSGHAEDLHELEERLDVAAHV